VQLPLGKEDGFRGVIDLVKMRAVVWEEDTLGAKFHEEPIPPEMAERVAEAREKLLEAVAEVNAGLLEKYLMGGQIDAAELGAAIRAATIALKFTPVVCGTSFRNKGVQPLLDAVVDYLPSPMDVPPVVGLNPGDDSETTRKADDDEPLAALAFKIMNDPFVGHLTFIRVYSGTLNSGDHVYNPLRQKKERIGRLLKMHANKREDIKTATGRYRRRGGLEDRLHRRHPVRPGAPDRTRVDPGARAVISIAIEPKTTADQERLGFSLQKLMMEDPSFQVRNDEETGQTLISGWASCTSRSSSTGSCGKFKVEANVGRPQVAYRETITRPAGRKALRSPDRRTRPVRHVGSPSSREKGSRSNSSTRSSGRRPEGNTSVPSRRGSSRPPNAASSRAIPWST
jgi:elongation factor G